MPFGPEKRLEDEDDEFGNLEPDASLDNPYGEEPGSLFDDPNVLLRHGRSPGDTDVEASEFDEEVAKLDEWGAEADAEVLAPGEVLDPEIKSLVEGKSDSDEDGFLLPEEEPDKGLEDVNGLRERAARSAVREAAADDVADEEDLRKTEAERRILEEEALERRGALRGTKVRLLRGGKIDNEEDDDGDDDNGAPLSPKGQRIAAVLRLLREEDEHLALDGGDATAFRAITLSPGQLQADLGEAMASLWVRDWEYADMITQHRPRARGECNSSPVTNNFEPRDGYEWVDPKNFLNWAVRKKDHEDLAIQSGDNEGVNFSPNDTPEEDDARFDADEKGIPFKTRDEAIRDSDVVRRCPLVGCRFHPFLAVGRKGSLKLNSPVHIGDPASVPCSCILDEIDASPGGVILERVGEILNLTRERIRQTESNGFIAVGAANQAMEAGKTLAEILAGDDLIIFDDLREPDRSIYEIGADDPDAKLVDQDVGLDFRPLAL